MGFDLGIGEIAAAASLAGSATSAIGAISGGNAAAAQSNYQAQVARNNELIAGRNANYTIASGEAKAYDQGLKERQRAGAIKAAIAAGGIDVNSGSAVDVEASQAGAGATDVSRVRENAALQAYGYRTQASNFGAESQLDTAKAGFDQTSGLLKGFGSLLSNASSLPGKFDWMKGNVTGDYGGGGEFGLPEQLG